MMDTKTGESRKKMLFLNILFYITAFIVALIPLYFDSSIHQIFALGKAYFLKGSISIVAFFWAALFLVSDQQQEFSAKVPLSLKNARPLLFPLLGLMGIYLLATYFSIDPWMSFVGVYGRFFGAQGMLASFLIFLILTTTFRQKKQIPHFLFFIFLSGTLTGLLAFLQFFQLDPWSWTKTLYEKVYSATGNANFCGHILATILPCSFYFWATSLHTSLKKNKSVWSFSFLFFNLCIFFMLFGLFASLTRGAWLSAFLTFIVIVCCCVKFIFLPTLKNLEETQQKRLSMITQISGYLVIPFLFFNLTAALAVYFIQGHMFIIVPFVALCFICYFGQKLTGFFKLNSKKHHLLLGTIIIFVSLSSFLLAKYTLKYTECQKYLSTLERTQKYGVTLEEEPPVDFEKYRPYLNYEAYPSLHFTTERIKRYFSIFDLKNIRYYLWRDSLATIAASPWIGHGPETYRRAFMPNKSLELAIASPMEEHDNPHNNFLSILAYMGIGGVIFYLWILIKMFLGGIHFLQKSLHSTHSSTSSHSQNKHHKQDILPDQLLAITFTSTATAIFSWNMFGFDTVVNMPTIFGLWAIYSIWAAQAHIASHQRAPINILTGLAAPLAGFSHKIPARLRNFYPSLKSTLIGKYWVGGTEYLFLILCFPYCAYTLSLNFDQRKADQYFISAFRESHYFMELLSKGDAKNAQAILPQLLNNLQGAIFHNPQESYYHLILARVRLEQAKFAENPADRQQILKAHAEILLKAQEHVWAPEALLSERYFSAIIQNNLEEAIERAKDVLGISPYKFDLRISLEKLYYTLKTFQKSPVMLQTVLDNSEIILKLNEEQLFSRLFAIDLQLMKGDWRKALTHAKALLEQHPDKKEQWRQVFAKIDEVKGKGISFSQEFP